MMPNKEELNKIAEKLKKDIGKYEKLIETEKNKVPPNVFDWLSSSAREIVKKEEETSFLLYNDFLLETENHEYGMVRKLMENIYLHTLLEAYQKDPERFDKGLKKTDTKGHVNL
jgi:hypothetical protein